MQSAWSDLAGQLIRDHRSNNRDGQYTIQLYAGSLKSCKTLSEARRIEARILSSRHAKKSFLINLMIEMYGKCGSLHDARSIFENNAGERNVFTWNIIVAAYARNRELKEAKRLFDRMPVRDVVSWNAMIAAYAQNGHLDEARDMFDNMPKKSNYSWNSLISAYAQLGYLEDAKELLFTMPNWDRFSWTTVIGAYANAGQSEDAVMLFRIMDLEGIEADSVTFTAVLDACASHSTLTDGKAIHASMMECGGIVTTVVATSLVNMYGKCGKLKQARSIFDTIQPRDVVLWTCLVTAYAHAGYGVEAMEAFRLMLLEGSSPDGVIYVTALTACNHSGMLELGLQFFASMLVDYGIRADVLHYACMVDMLGKAGWLAHAEVLLAEMPYNPDVACWTAMLAACKLHKDKERAEKASQHVFELDPENSSPYAMLVNIHKGTTKATKINNLRRERRVRKLIPGCSRVVVKDKVHYFTARDVEHPRAEEIYAELERLRKLMEAAGYVADTAVVVQQVSEEEKQRIVFSHSEKLAVAYGLIATPKETAIRVVNNIRMCSDCHSAMKLIAKLTNREIVVRDLIRFHRFDSRGFCSCGDYW